MSSVSKSVEINLDAEERELLEKAIKKCKEIAQNCAMEDVFMEESMIFECLVNDYNSNHGHLAAQIEVEE